MFLRPEYESRVQININGYSVPLPCFSDLAFTLKKEKNNFVASRQKYDKKGLESTLV